MDRISEHTGAGHWGAGHWGAGDAQAAMPGPQAVRLRRGLPGLAAAGAVLVLGAMALVLLVLGQAAITQRRETARIERQADLAQDLATALVTAENGARGFVLSGDPGALEPYYRGREQVQVALARAADHLEEWRRRGHVDRPLAEIIAQRLAGLGLMVDLAYRELADPATPRGRLAVDPGGGDGLRRGLDRAIADMRAETADHLDRINRRADILLPAMTAVLVLGLALSALGFTAFRRESRERRQADAELDRHRREVALLRGLAQGMQTVHSRDAGHHLIAEQLADVLADCSGIVFAYDHQRNRFAAVADWGPLIIDADRADMPAERCWAALRGHPVTGQRGQTQPCCGHVHSDGYCFRCVPILVEGEVAGILHLRVAPGADPAAAFAGLGSLPEAAAGLLGLVLAPLDMRERLDALALRDPLTGLCNRGFLYEVLGRELDRAATAGQPVSLIMADIDRFQTLTDRHGHRAGDEVVKTVAGHLRNHLRDSDLLCRFAGDKLALLLPDTDLDEAMRIAEQMRCGVARLRPVVGREIIEDLSLSLGVAGAGRNGHSPEALVAAADRAVSRAKLDGRDRVMRADEPVGMA